VELLGKRLDYYALLGLNLSGIALLGSIAGILVFLLVYLLVLSSF
jgi:hypothetical protein